MTVVAFILAVAMVMFGAFMSALTAVAMWDFLAEHLSYGWALAAWVVVFARWTVQAASR